MSLVIDLNYRPVDVTTTITNWQNTVKSLGYEGNVANQWAQLASTMLQHPQTVCVVKQGERLVAMIQDGEFICAPEFHSCAKLTEKQLNIVYQVDALARQRQPI